MNRIPPLYVCPDCEPGPYMYAGKIFAKVYSACSDAKRNAQTGYDRARTGADRLQLSRLSEIDEIVRRLRGGS